MLGNIFWDLYALCYDGLNSFNPYKKLLEKVMEAADLRPGQKILDAGCGTGNFEALMEKKTINAEVTAADFSPMMLARGRKKCFWLKAQWKKIDLNESSPFSDKEFDRIISINSFYNLTNHRGTLKEFYRVLKIGGILVLTTPKTGSDAMLILKAHRHNHESEEKWRTKSFWMWLWLVLRVFGLTGTAVKFITIAIFNKKLFKTMKGFEKDELESLLRQSGFKILTSGSAYADQNLIIKAQKEEKSKSVIYKIAETIEEKNSSFQLRYVGYCLEHGWLNKNDYSDKKEKDEWDDTAHHFIALQDNQIIGTVRLLPMKNDQFYSQKVVSEFCFKDEVLKQGLEVSRMYIKQSERAKATGTTFGLLRIAKDFSLENNFFYWYFAITETANIIMHKLGWKFIFIGKTREVKLNDNSLEPVILTPALIDLRDKSIRIP